MTTFHSSKRFEVPYLGFGIGLRPKHYSDLLNSNPPIDFLEIISENFMLDGGRALHYLDRFLERYKIIPHGVSLAIGNASDLDKNYLKKLKKLVQKVNPPWFSDHICWAGHEGRHMHNLMPLPYTDAVVTFVADKIRIVQDMMERPFLLENVSSYVEFKESTMTEWEFLAALLEKADCGILLDINNVYVSSRNHAFDPMTYLNAIPKNRVIQYHIAGHLDKGTYILDTHDHEIRDEVWELYRQAIPLFGDVSLIIERDDHIPPLNEIIAELETAKSIHGQVVTA